MSVRRERLPHEVLGNNESQFTTIERSGDSSHREKKIEQHDLCWSTRIVLGSSDLTAKDWTNLSSHFLVPDGSKSVRKHEGRRPRSSTFTNPQTYLFIKIINHRKQFDPPQTRRFYNNLPVNGRTNSVHSNWLKRDYY